MISFTRRRWPLLFGISAVAIVALVLAACGEDYEKPTPAATSAPVATRPPAPTTPPPAATTAPAGQTKASDIRNFQLESFTIRVGASVIWTNRDGAPHTATSGSGTATGVFNTGNLNQNQASQPIRFDRAGTFPYFCQVHGASMSGTITVTS